jgi:hypothetical protein
VNLTIEPFDEAVTDPDGGLRAAHATTADLAGRVATLFPGTGFTVTSQTRASRITWYDGPAARTVGHALRAAGIGPVLDVHFQQRGPFGAALTHHRKQVADLNRRLTPHTAAKMTVHLLRAGFNLTEMHDVIRMTSIPDRFPAGDEAAVTLLTDRARELTSGPQLHMVFRAAREIGPAALLELGSLLHA